MMVMELSSMGVLSLCVIDGTAIVIQYVGHKGTVVAEQLSAILPDTLDTLADYVIDLHGQDIGLWRPGLCARVIIWRSRLIEGDQLAPEGIKRGLCPVGQVQFG